MGAKNRKTDIYTEMSLANWGDGPPVSETMWLDGWGYDRVQAQEAAEFPVWSAAARAADVLAAGASFWSGGNPTFSEAEEALREEIQAQAEVIEAQDWQIEALKEERDALLAELDAKDAQWQWHPFLG